MSVSQREIFFKHIAQTSPTPLGIEIEKAEGVFIFDITGKKYLDFISGISVSNIGHLHPKVKQAIIEQLNKYAHIMVYGETIQSPQTKYAQLIMDYLPDNLNCIYYVNSGTEAIEGAMKLCRAYTQRYEIVSFENAYHGSTQGAMSIMGNEQLKQKFRPLIPGNKILKWHDENELNKITEHTAAVFVEPIRAEAGVLIPNIDYMHALRNKCNEVSALLVLDEIQTGFGRTGKLFAYEHFHIIPDILVLGKAMGGGLPIGSFISDKKIMETFTYHPLGHLTTFGGNAICVASALATLQVIIQEQLYHHALEIENILLSKLIHPSIKAVRVKGAMAAIQLENNEKVLRVIERCLNEGLIIDWFLFAPDCIRIAPPLIITKQELYQGLNIILQSL